MLGDRACHYTLLVPPSASSLCHPNVPPVISESKQPEVVSDDHRVSYDAKHQDSKRDHYQNRVSNPPSSSRVAIDADQEGDYDYLLDGYPNVVAEPISEQESDGVGLYLSTTVPNFR